MSNSDRAKERRRKRNKLSKGERARISKQNFGDKYVIGGRKLKKSEDKAEILARMKAGDEI